ncbi:MAG: DEAD/DEAH box helicase [Firmicutes bacterium]|nr:DEAD/DEAH box helicase [Bacillota bacterium]
MSITFDQLRLSDDILQAVKDMGFEEATPIQAQTIPLALAGRDLVGQAQTGTGKTAAFGIPLIEQVDLDASHVQCLILAPTRELAVQVAAELNQIGRYKGVTTVPIYGGQDISRQIRLLKKHPQIVAGTPGRLLDHMRRRTIRLENVRMVVLDEADEMLNMGFMEDIETILGELPAERQTLLFSATMPESIRRLASRFLHNPEQVTIPVKELTMPSIEQYYIEVSESQKFDTLCRLLDMQAPELAIVFGRTKRRVDELYSALGMRGYSAEAIHGDMTQSRRDNVMRRFRSGQVDILVATDVAARGLDVTGVTHVYNFDLPQDPEWYVHRIGRTGRAGASGVAISFVTPREIGYLRHLERLIRRRIERKPIPSMTDALEGQLRLAAENLLQVAADAKLEAYRGLAEELLGSTDSVTLLAAALKIMTREPNATPVNITAEEPARFKARKQKRGKQPRSRSGQRQRSRRRRDF